MLGVDVDMSLAEAMLWMLRILVWIAVGSFVAGLATLPLFFFVLSVLNGWFWSLDESRDSSAGTGRLRRLAAPILVWLIPAASLAATLFLESYFFGGSTGSEGGAQAKQAAWGKLRFDEFTRAIAKSMPRKPAEAPPANADPAALSGLDPEAEAIKRPLQAVRALGMIFLLLVGPFPITIIVLTQLIGRMGPVLIIRSLSRNLLRTGLTYLAIFVLVCVITFIWSILGFLALVTQEKEGNLKAIITERKQIPSQMKPSHENELKAMIKELPEQNRPKNGDEDIMTWAFVGGSLDPKNRTPQNSLFLFCMQPKKLLTMMDGLEELTGEQARRFRKGRPTRWRRIARGSSSAGNASPSSTRRSATRFS